MIAKNRDFAVRGVVDFDLLLRGQVVVNVLGQLLLKCDRRVISTEDLGSQSRHDGGQVLVQHGRGQRVEDIVCRLLSSAEFLQVVVHHLANTVVLVLVEVNFLVKAHGILSQKVELKSQRFLADNAHVLL